MDTKNFLKFASFIPILALNFNLNLSGFPNQLGFAKQISEEDLANTALYKQAQAIDGYFSARNMPLFGYGLKMAQEARKYNLDWRLLPAISVQESGGGKHAVWRCKNNPFGWASCNIKFENTNKAIETVALNLSGSNPKTEKYYKNKGVKEKLHYYNGTVISHYPQTVLAIMDKFDNLKGDYE